MDRIVFYSEGLEPEFIQQALPSAEVVTVYSQRRLIEALVDEPFLIGAIVDIGTLTPEWKVFLESAARSFAVLPVLVAVEEEYPECPEGFVCIDRNGSDTVVADALVKRFGDCLPKNRRQYHRFNWPLTARVVDDDGTVHKVTEISAGGAFLEPHGSALGPEEQCELEIYFQNFVMTTSCTILDPRRVASHREPGFGVRFDNLSDSAREFINRIVSDALIQVLTDPTTEPPVPSIETEEDVFSIGDEFSLS
jgi:hypothetical protein